MALALGRLAWAPGIFWAATPVELAAMIEGRTGRAAPTVTRAAFERLRETYPDA